MSLIRILGLTLLLSLSTITVNTAADDDGTWAYSLTGGGTATITGCVETCPVELVIPGTINGYSLRSIGDAAFDSNQLTGVISIGNEKLKFQGVVEKRLSV